MDWEEQQKKLIKLKKAKDILATNERVARMVLVGDIDKTTAKIISQYINNSIKCLELLQYEDQIAELEQTINTILGGGA
mgnify:FL=1